MTKIYRLKNSEEWEEIPFSNLNIRLTYNKATTAQFDSNFYLNEEEEIKIVSNNHPEFGGIIHQISVKTNEASHNYECVDYTPLLFNKINYTTPKKGKNSTKIIQEIVKNRVNTSGVKNTKKVHKKLIFKKKSLWEIIQTLQTLDYNNGEKINLYIDKEGVLNYKPYSQSTQHIIKTFYNHDYSYQKKEEEINKTFFKKYKNIYHQKTIKKDNKGLYKPQPIKKINSSNKKETEKNIKNLHKHLLKEKIKYDPKNKDYLILIQKKRGNSQALSRYVFEELKSKGVIVRIIQDNKKTQHNSIQYKKGKNKKDKWTFFPYKGLDHRFKNSAVEKLNIIKTTL